MFSTMDIRGEVKVNNICMSDLMIQAYQAGRKNQTRRMPAKNLNQLCFNRWASW
jgi:hypothetical protein